MDDWKSDEKPLSKLYYSQHYNTQLYDLYKETTKNVKYTRSGDV